MDTTTTAQTYQTPNGPKTIAQMQSELATAGYNGPTDDASIIATYNQTALGTSSGGASSSTQSSAQAMLDAIASGDQQKFDESVREFNLNYALDQQKQALAQTTQYGNLASNLLSTAASLRGPADYYQYWSYLNGGKDLMNSLYGNTPLPTFQAPSGANTPVTLSGLLNSLGLGGSTAAGATTGTAGSTTTPATTSPVSSTATAVGASTTPATTTATPAASATPTVSSGPSVATEPARSDPYNFSALFSPQTNNDYSGNSPTTIGPPAAPSGVSAAPPASGNQVNPAVWDSLGPVGQALTLSAISAGGGDAQSWLNQLNASRPQGTAPAASTTSFGSTTGSY